MKETIIQGLHHVSLKPAGYAAFRKTVAFYQEVLGLPLIRAWGEGDTSAVMLSLGNSILEISAAGTEVPPVGAINHFALATADVDAVAERIRQAGYEITVEPGDRQPKADYPIRIAFCVGPVGESIELFYEKNRG